MFTYLKKRLKGHGPEHVYNTLGYTVKVGLAVQIMSRYTVKVGLADQIMSRYTVKVGLADQIMSRYTVKVGLAVQIMSRYTGRGLQNLIREAESRDDRMSDSSDSDNGDCSDSTDSGVSSDNGQRDNVINPRLKIIWHSWHLWPCSLPKIQNKFIWIIIWSGDNKTQRNTARERIHAHRYTNRGKRKDVLQCCWEKSDKPCTEWIFRYVLSHGDKTCRCDKTCRQTSQYDTGWQNSVKRPIFNIPGASSARWRTRGIPKVFSHCGDIAHIGQAWQ